MSFFNYTLARMYAHLYVLVKSVTGRSIPGLGFLLRRCKKSRYIEFLNQQLYFEPTVASSYGLHIIKLEQEPESHKFLNDLFGSLGGQRAYFIEVGANIGAFMVDLARRNDVHVFGFEPSRACVEAINKTMLKNGRKNYTTYACLVGDQEGLVPFSEGLDVHGASVYTSVKSSCKIRQVKLDDVKDLGSLPSAAPTVIMIDVEGYELNVLRGGLKLIHRIKPLIIFEYNAVSKRYFNIDQIYKVLGGSYEIFRLRKDAMLDGDVEDAWNCVAIPCGTRFEKTLESRIIF